MSGSQKAAVSPEPDRGPDSPLSDHSGIWYEGFTPPPSKERLDKLGKWLDDVGTWWDSKKVQLDEQHAREAACSSGGAAGGGASKKAVPRKKQTRGAAGGGASKKAVPREKKPREKKPRAGVRFSRRVIDKSTGERAASPLLGTLRKALGYTAPPDEPQAKGKQAKGKKGRKK